MNAEQLAEKRRLDERQVLTFAAHFRVFSLDDIWQAKRWFHYGWLSRLLLRWWREDGLVERWDAKTATWRTGFPWSKAGRSEMPGPAIYRWVE